MSYHWTKSKYRKIHSIVFLVRLLGLIPILILINILYLYFGENVLVITFSFFIVFFWIGIPGEFSTYLTGESVSRFGGLIIERKRKGRGTIAQLALSTARTCIIASIILTILVKFITLYR